MTVEGDLVLVYMDAEPAFFARVEAITQDVKPEWFQVKMLVLQVPLVVITWILRAPYINGEEFTMGGRPIKMVQVVSPEEGGTEQLLESSMESVETTQNTSEASTGQKVVSLADRRKK